MKTISKLYKSNEPVKDFVSAIIENEGLTGFLIFADWLEEQGDQKANFIRDYVQLLTKYEPKTKENTNSFDLHVDYFDAFLSTFTLSRLIVPALLYSILVKDKKLIEWLDSKITKTHHKTYSITAILKIIILEGMGLTKICKHNFEQYLDKVIHDIPGYTIHKYFVYNDVFKNLKDFSNNRPFLPSTYECIRYFAVSLTQELDGYWYFGQMLDVIENLYLIMYVNEFTTNFDCVFEEPYDRYSY